jgi:hypothetical protein
MSARTVNTSLTVLNGNELFPPAPTEGPDVALWTPVQLAAIADDAVPAIPAEGSRIYVKPNEEPGFDNAKATKGTRSVKFAIGGSAIDTTVPTGSTANCILFQVVNPGGAEPPLNPIAPTVTAQLSAEADTELGAQMDGIITMAPLIANIVAVDGDLLTVCVTMAVPRTAKGIIQVEVNFGYSASN